MSDNPAVEIATFGAGCFWCVEAVFQLVGGVTKVVSGYSGGKVENPGYEAVCRGDTGHAEVCQITFDPGKVSYDELLGVFWRTHDPTTIDQQGNDKGPQYRSAVFYHNAAQKAAAEEKKRELDDSGKFSAPIVTEITPYTNFYPAEKYHQNYFNLNPQAPYCRVVIEPKLKKFSAGQ